MRRHCAHSTDASPESSTFDESAATRDFTGVVPSAAPALLVDHQAQHAQVADDLGHHRRWQPEALVAEAAGVDPERC